jgi:hypothetical protein
MLQRSPPFVGYATNILICSGRSSHVYLPDVSSHSIFNFLVWLTIGLWIQSSLMNLVSNAGELCSTESTSIVKTGSNFCSFIFLESAIHTALRNPNS